MAGAGVAEGGGDRGGGRVQRQVGSTAEKAERGRSPPGGTYPERTGGFVCFRRLIVEYEAFIQRFCLQSVAFRIRIRPTIQILLPLGGLTEAHPIPSSVPGWGNN